MTIWVKLLIARDRSVGNVTILLFRFKIIQIMSKTRVKRSIRFISSSRRPSRVFYVSAMFTRALAYTCARRGPTKVEPKIGWLRILPITDC